MRIEVRESAVEDLSYLSLEEARNILLTLKKILRFPNIENMKKFANYDPPYRVKIGRCKVLFDFLEGRAFIARVIIDKHDCD